MPSTLIPLDREQFEHSFREWQAEQSQLEAELAESFAALDAYQSHLDSWQQELIRERDEVEQLRQASVWQQNGADSQEQVEQLSHELAEARDKIASLTTALLSRTEELRDLDQQREGTNTELTRAREREKQLQAELEAQKRETEARQHPAERQASSSADQSSTGDASKQGAAKPDPRRGASPVLGSVMEQFGKLREQRSMNRSNIKPR